MEFWRGTEQKSGQILCCRCCCSLPLETCLSSFWNWAFWGRGRWDGWVGLSKQLCTVVFIVVLLWSGSWVPPDEAKRIYAFPHGPRNITARAYVFVVLMRILLGCGPAFWCLSLRGNPSSLFLDPSHLCMHSDHCRKSSTGALRCRIWDDVIPLDLAACSLFRSVGLSCQRDVKIQFPSPDPMGADPNADSFLDSNLISLCM